MSHPNPRAGDNSDTTEFVIVRTPPPVDPIYPSGDSRAPTPPPGPASVQASVNQPLEGMATVAQLDGLSNRFESRLIEIERTLTMSVENSIFVRTQEYLAERYEDRIANLGHAVEGLRKEVLELQDVCSRLEAVRPKIEEVRHQPNPVVGIGNVPSARGSIPIALDSQAPQEQAQEHERSLQNVVTELSSTLRMVKERLDDRGQEASMPNPRVPTNGVPPHEGGPLSVDPTLVGYDYTPDVWIGEEYPGLEPLRTLQTPFVKAVSYRAYRLLNARQSMTAEEAGRAHKKASYIRGAFPHIANFSGRNPSKLLSFLKQFKSACDHMGIHEGLAVRVISFFLEEEAYRFFGTLSSSSLRRVGGLNLVWPVLVHRLLKRYCTEDVLTKAYDKVVRAKQRDNESEGDFADRIQDAAIECGDVFDEKALVSHFVSGLLPTVRYSIAESVLQHGADIDLSIARRMAVAAGETHRAQMTASKPISRSRTSPRTMVVEPHPEWAVTPSSTAVSRTPLMILPTANAGHELSDTTSVATEEKETFVPDKSSNEETQPSQPVGTPQLNEADAQTALKMMTRNRGGTRCWGCREDGHDLYNCPYLSWEVRMLFAKANYDYQAEVRGTAVADSHLRMRGHSPSRHRPTRGGNGYRKVNFSSPPVIAGRSSGARSAGFRNPEAKGKHVLVASPNPESSPVAHDSDHSSSTSSGN